jgi:hypothetical protein
VNLNAAMGAQAFQQPPAINSAAGPGDSNDYFGGHFARCSVFRTKSVLFLASAGDRKL